MLMAHGAMGGVVNLVAWANKMYQSLQKRRSSSSSTSEKTPPTPSMFCGAKRLCTAESKVGREGANRPFSVGCGVQNNFFL